MAQTAEEARIAHAQKQAKADRDRELATRKGRKDAQTKTQSQAHRPLVWSS